MRECSGSVCVALSNNSLLLCPSDIFQRRFAPSPSSISLLRRCASCARGKAAPARASPRGRGLHALRAAAACGFCARHRGGPGVTDHTYLSYACRRGAKACLWRVVSALAALATVFTFAPSRVFFTASCGARHDMVRRSGNAYVFAGCGSRRFLPLSRCRRPWQQRHDELGPYVMVHSPALTGVSPHTATLKGCLRSFTTFVTVASARRCVHVVGDGGNHRALSCAHYILKNNAQNAEPMRKNSKRRARNLSCEPRR